MTNPAAHRRVLRIQLGIKLREWRDRARITSKDAARALESDPSRLSRLERGGATIRAAEVDRLLELYGVPEEHAAELRALGREARRRGFATPVPAWAQTYVALELIAAEIKIYNGELVPGLLQTGDYARALLSTSDRLIPPDRVDQAVATRLGRQERLTAATPLQLRVVLGEAVLHRPVGGPAVLRDQLVRLRELVALGSMSIQFVPYHAGGHAALGTSFTLFRLADPAATFVYIEWLTDAVYLEPPGRPMSTNPCSMAYCWPPPTSAGRCGCWTTGSVPSPRTGDLRCPFPT